MQKGNRKLVFSMWFAVALISVSPLHAESADPAAPVLASSAWLQKIAEDTSKQSYQGTFIYRCNAQLVTMKITHAANQGNGYEKLVALNGPAHEVVQNGQSMTSSLFRGKRALVNGISKSGYGTFEKILNEQYKISVVGDDRIANRPTSVVEISPSDKFRYGFMIWLDNETGIVLRSDMRDDAGNIVEQIMFVDIAMLSDQEAALSISDDKSQLVGGEEPSEMAQAKAIALDGSQWRVNGIPAGFRLSERYLRKEGDHGVNQEQLVYTDGLASVSVFIEPHQGNEEPMLGETHIGAVNVFGKIVNDHQIMVVGDVPKATVEYIAGALSRE